MKLEKTPPWLTALFEELSATLPGQPRKMFGSLCMFARGNLYCGTFASTIFVRLSEEDRARLLAIEGAAPFSPLPGRAMSKYVTLPRDLLEDEQAARAWLEKGARHALSLPEKLPKKKKSKKQPR